MFGGFWSTALLAPVLLAILASPLFYQARRLGRKDTIKSFTIGGTVVAILVASLAYVSDQNVNQCFEAGNTGCLDAGTTGMQILFIFGYVIPAWFVARTLSDQ